MKRRTPAIKRDHPSSPRRAGTTACARATPASAPGRPCPKCRRGTLAYNTLWQLVCDRCGHIAESGSFS